MHINIYNVLIFKIRKNILSHCQLMMLGKHISWKTRFSEQIERERRADRKNNISPRSIQRFIHV